MITQENKDLLLKDLCARLPYEVKFPMMTFDGVIKPYILYSMSKDGKCYASEGGYYPYIEDIKPYLFPLSSMAEEQQEEFDKIYADDMQVVANNLKNRLDGQPYETNFGHFRHIDWLNKNHFDYRGLIPMGLALDATGLNIY